jgi:hypothetical protein
MKPKKKNRPFRCTDTLYQLIQSAAVVEEMSVNQWIEYAIRSQLKDGIQQGGIDVEAESGMATATALDEATNSAMQLEKAMERHRLFWAAQMAKLKEKAKQKPNIK